MRIALAGGAGVVGRHVERLARAAGHDVVTLVRSRGIDLVTGQGLNLAAVDVVIDVSGPSADERGDSVEFFERATTNLLNAEEDAGVGHHIALSIVGAAHVNAGYYAGKRVQEDLVAAGLSCCGSHRPRSSKGSSTPTACRRSRARGPAGAPDRRFAARTVGCSR